MLEIEVVGDLFRHQGHRGRNLRGTGCGLVLRGVPGMAGHRGRGGHGSGFAGHVAALVVIPR
ncbi:MAG: hypothetical protein AUH86_03755 [Acidobacteria bacterium 13_1_40CM_4_58_4]|nr:MAG: hypothetical protein AUH86_03755 [Acidobacteria bacterium 13_1_40CM_4_58_4]